MLWIDDQIDKFVNTLDYKSDIENYLKELFFIPIIDICETVDEAKILITGKKYDLILSDYNIDTEKGDAFIRYIRDQHVNTEILFYTAQREPLMVDERSRDRISFFIIPDDLYGFPAFLEKIKQLIDLTIEKLQDLTVIRGLVMAETSQIDKLMEEIIFHYFVTQKNNERDSIWNKLMDEMEKNQKDKLDKSTNNCEKKCTLKLRKKEVKDIIKSLEFESSRKAKTINKIMEQEKYDYNTTNKNYFEDYKSEISEHRNNLAHSYSEEKNGIEVIITKKDEGEIVYDKNKFKEIRENILKYLDALNKLKVKLG
jgi:CheY-like chemotaxis protein